MSNVMSLKSFSNNVKRNGFDLSFKNAFTAKAGELLPVMVKEVIPGDKFKISAQSFTRTQPLNTAAYVRMREYYDVFFVPYRLLWNRFPTFFTNLPDFHHAATLTSAGNVGSQHPFFTVADIKNYLYALDSLEETGIEDYKKQRNFFGFRRNNLTVKLLSYLGYGEFNPSGEAYPPGSGPSPGDGYTDTVLNPSPLLAYQKIYQDFYRDDQWEKAAPYTYNLDYITSDEDLHINIDYLASFISPELNMFDLRYSNFAKDYFMGQLPSSQYGSESFVPIGAGSGAFQLVQAAHPELNLGTGSLNGVGKFVTGGDVSAGYPFSSVFGSVNYIPGVENNVELYAKEGGDGLSHQVYPSFEGSINSSINFNDFGAYVDSVSAGGNLYVLALRQAEALQKWKEIAQSGKQDYRTQMQKHFGVTPSYAMSDHCHYVGGWTSNIDVNEVVNTNLSSDSYSANIFGKGVGTGKGGVDFDAKEHGILMVIYHNQPLLDWQSIGTKKLNLKTNFTDYAIPEFDSVGMQQLTQFELFGAPSGALDSSIQLGYVPRYADYKTSYDEIHGAFADSLIGWVAPLTEKWLQNYVSNVNSRYGSFQLVYEFFKVNPAILDNLFGVNANSDNDTDQFLVNAFFDVKCVRNLDYNGLPY